MRVLGIDYGAKRIGLALGDTETCVATPWDVLSEMNMLGMLAKIHDAIQRDGVEAIVVGVPRPLKEPMLENEQMRTVRAFIDRVKAH
jgi:putative holliday junction resolvase